VQIPIASLFMADRLIYRTVMPSECLCEEKDFCKEVHTSPTLTRPVRRPDDKDLSNAHGMSNQGQPFGGPCMQSCLLSSVPVGPKEVQRSVFLSQYSFFLASQKANLIAVESSVRHAWVCYCVV
jgi:hypothetical protein